MNLCYLLQGSCFKSVEEGHCSNECTESCGSWGSSSSGGSAAAAGKTQKTSVSLASSSSGGGAAAAGKTQKTSVSST